MRIQKHLLALSFFTLALGAWAQESQFQAELRHEGEHFKKDCGQFSLKSIGSCGQLLFTGHPLHVAAGSIAPQNGFAFGPAFVTHLTPNERWRINWNGDAVASSNGSWRAGVYMKAIYIPEEKIVMRPGGAGKPKPKLAVHPYPVFNVYAQGISLNKLTYFGSGPETTPEGRSFYGMRETIVGTNVLWPLFKG